MPKLPDPPFNLKDLMQPVPNGGHASTNTREEIAAMRDRAGQDLTDIAALRKNDVFDRFFLRRVRQKRDRAIRALIGERGERRDAMTSEALRHEVLALEEVLTLLEDDDKAARSMIA